MSEPTGSWCVFLVICVFVDLAPAEIVTPDESVNAYLSPPRLLVRQESLQTDFGILRNLTVDCELFGLYISFMDENFHLKRQDIELLSRCPLKGLDIASETFCFPPLSHIDMSTLAMLRRVNFQCRSGTFTITGLPDSLTWLNIQYMAEHNIALDYTDGRFGDSLVISVKKASMCCPESIRKMFGRDLPQVECQYRLMNFKMCGFSENGTKLGLVRHDHIALFRNISKDDCRLTQLFLELPEFTLTQEDIKSLEQCPLKALMLFDSRCLSGSAVDLSGLKHVTYLIISYCRRSDFVIIDLPASLETAWLYGLAEFNVRLAEKSLFGDSLKELVVYSSAMCCNNTLYSMFSRDLSSVCQDMALNWDWESGMCGWNKRWTSETTLSVDSRDQLHSFIEQDGECGEGECGQYIAGDGCSVNALIAAGKKFYLQQRDIDILSRCTLKHLVLSYTSCFSGSINLSQLSNLENICIPHCSQLNFTITSLPATLKEIDIRGINVENIQIRKSGRSFYEKTDENNTCFGSSLQRMEVSNPATCQCPQTVTRMFGAPLGESVT